jgi:hypothetical protein
LEQIELAVTQALNRGLTAPRHLRAATADHGARAECHRPPPAGARSLRYREAATSRQAVDQRLKTNAAGDGPRVVRGRKRVAFDRFLARLNIAAPDGWLLKGGFALDLRSPSEPVPHATSTSSGRQARTS